MLALAGVLVVVLVSMLITRVATAALVLTGMSEEAARFQARSALSGVGFTTSEAESVVGHPVRRRIAMTLMLLGSAGVVSVIATVVLSFAGTSGGQAATRLAALLGGLLVLLLLSRSSLVDRWLSVVIRRALRRWTDLDVRDLHRLLHLANGFGVTELAVRTGDWIAGQTLAGSGLRDEGVVVLGIERRGGGFLAAPRASDRIEAGDVLLAYGSEDRLSELDRRPHGPEGDRAHEAAVAEHRVLHDRVFAETT